MTPQLRKWDLPRSMWMHHPGGILGLMKHSINLHCGNCRIQDVWTWAITATTHQDLGLYILTILWQICLTSPPTFWPLSRGDQNMSDRGSTIQSGLKPSGRIYGMLYWAFRRGWCCHEAPSPWLLGWVIMGGFAVALNRCFDFERQKHQLIRSP